MTDTTRCAHVDTVPVEVRDHATGGTRVVAHVCRCCLDRLPAAWGCAACEWDYLEERALCEPRSTTRVLLSRPCADHLETE